MEIKICGAAQQVTGSCYLIDLEGQKVLVDCGLVQGSVEHEKMNHQPFPFNVAEIDAVVVTHAHLDHSGRLPLLYKQGYRGPIYTHPATKDLCRIMLLDAAFINGKDVEMENRRRQRKHLPEIPILYSSDDVDAIMPQFKDVAYDEMTTILPGVRIRLNDAGHIIGSAIIEVFISVKGLQRKIVFSGDLGHPGAPLLPNPKTIQDANLIFMESTYGDRLHRSWQATWNELGEAIADAKRNKGIILIPSFAIGRTQNLLYAFKKHYEAWKLGKWRIFLDSPMAIEATEVYEKYTDLYDAKSQQLMDEGGDLFTLPNLHLSRSGRDSMKLNQLTSGAIIIAGSGMCNGGRMQHHLKHHIWQKNCSIFFIGYQAAGTLGRKIVDGANEIKVWGEEIKVAAHIYTIGGLSAHADQQHLLNWYGAFSNNPPLVLIHGEPQSMQALADKIYQKYTVHPIMPTYGAVIDLHKV